MQGKRLEDAGLVGLTRKVFELFQPFGLEYNCDQHPYLNDINTDLVKVAILTVDAVLGF